MNCSPATTVYGNHTGISTLHCSSGSLPFTGFNLLDLVIVATVLIALSLTMRRYARR